MLYPVCALGIHDTLKRVTWWIDSQLVKQRLGAGHEALAARFVTIPWTCIQYDGGKTRLSGENGRG
jgi:hypothetical protein